MRSLLIHQNFVHPKDGGGTRHYEFGRYLTEKGDQFTVITSPLSYLSGEKESDKSTEAFDDPYEPDIKTSYAMPVLHASFVLRVLSFLSFTFSSFFKAVGQSKVDVYVGTTPPIFQSLGSWMASAVRRKPFMLEVRDLWPEFAIDMGVLSNKFIIKLSYWLEQFLYNRADQLVVNSPAYVDYLVGKGFKREDIAFIPNGVDVDSFDTEPDRNVFRKKWGITDEVVVLYAGALGYANNIGHILEAAKTLLDNPKIRFVLVGDGKEKENLKAYVAEHSLTNVHFEGVVSKVEMPLVLAATDICLATLLDIPMFSKVYPNKVFDYMAAARPSLITIDGVIREVVENAEGGIYVSPKDSADLTREIENLASQPELRQSMGRNAKAHVTKYFNRKDQAEEFRNLLHKTMKASKA